MTLLHNPHDKSTLYMTHILDLPQLVDMEVIIRIHILDRHLQQEIELAGDDKALHDLRHLLDGLDKFSTRPFVVFFERYITDRQQPFFYLGMIQQGSILPDDPRLFQPPDPLVYRRSTQMDLHRDLPNSDLGIVLQQA